MDFSSRREGCILGQSLGDIVVGSIYVMVFLVDLNVSKAVKDSIAGHNGEIGRTLVRTL